MFIPTDILRAALLCVAGEKGTREYLKGVYITPTHIKATDGSALVMMEHGCEAGNDIDGVFIFDGDIPDSAADAELTAIIADGNNWYAVHYDENEKPICSNMLELLDCQYPDFSRVLPPEPEPCDEFPMFNARLLALPYLMFRHGFGPVKFKPYGKGAPCQLLLDPATNHLYGNPFLVIMPMHDNAFEICQGVLDEI
ncbi:hypothetical protein [Yersinia hibernica]|uniref:Bacteriophage protein n=1 Tax=Yersinia enterocolitica LC20 TaxID=1443113 RepID=A0A7U4K0J1_YEREN|nr:hypothetical protein [Yersinia hibernica]AHM72970.1 hypothetical protein LC20_01717 [Yersinia hibernica]